jgi:hypothetical protein
MDVSDADGEAVGVVLGRGVTVVGVGLGTVGDFEGCLLLLVLGLGLGDTAGTSRPMDAGTGRTSR